MKRYIKTAICLFLSLITLFVICVTVFAEDSVSPEQLMDKDKLSEQAQEVYDNFSLKSLFKLVTESLKNTFYPSLPIFAGLVGLIIIASVINAFNINFGGLDIGGYVSVLCFSGYSFSVIKSLCDNLSSYTGKLREVMTVVAPTLIAASAADGPASAKVGYTGLTVTLTAAEYIITGIILPCVKILFVLSLVSCISGKSVDLRGISGSLRTFSVFSVSLVMTAIVTVMHFQNVIAKAVDSIGLRAVRFASVSFIPLVGGLVGESVKTVTEALRSVRGITGAAGIAAIISVCLPPIAAILVFKIEIIICTCLAKTLGCQTEAAILSDTGGILNVLNAALLASTIGFAAMICITAGIL